jgi:plastocyanin
MTDTTTTDEPEQTPAVIGDEAAAPTGEVAPAQPEPVKFWHRPHVEQFLVPLVLPIAVIFAVVVYVLNISRLFLSAHGNLPIVIGTVILLTILVGATMLSSGPHLKTPSVVLLTSIFLLAIAFSGWISLGHSEPENTGPTALPPELKTSQTIKITAAPGGALTFAPDALSNVKTGLVTFDITWAAPGHTFGFHETDTLFGELKDPGSGTSKGVAFFPSAGTYNFYCAIPGHEAAGMKGTVTVTGPTMTLEQAATAAGNPPDVVAALGGGGGE